VFSNDEEIEVVGFAATASEALLELERLSPHVLMLDDCCDEELIAMAAKLGIPSIVFSSRSEKVNVFEALAAGAMAYILKGTSIMLLLSAVKAVGSGATWLDPVIARKAVEVITDAHNKWTPHPTDSDSPVHLSGALSPRETEVLSLLCEGLHNEDIAKTLFVSPETVKSHVRNIMDKLQVRNRTEAAVQGIKLGLIDKHGSNKELAPAG
jgi:DNA-binding NarL/FixJ family response regulator